MWAIWLFLPGQLLSGQAQGSVTGKVIDASSREPLIAVHVSVDRRSGTTTDLDGAFSLSLDVGEHMIELSYMGYSDQQKEITLR